MVGRKAAAAPTTSERRRRRHQLDQQKNRRSLTKMQQDERQRRRPVLPGRRCLDALLLVVAAVLLLSASGRGGGPIEPVTAFTSTTPLPSRHSRTRRDRRHEEAAAASPLLPQSPTTRIARATQLGLFNNPAAAATSAAAAAGASSAILAQDGTGATSWTDSQIWTFLLQTLISNGVPALFTIIVIAFAAKAFGPNRRKGRRGGGAFDGDDDDGTNFDNFKSPAAALYRDLYGDQQQPGGGPSSPRNMFRRLFGGGGGRSPYDDDDSLLPANVGVPKEQYLSVTNMNRKFDSYRYSLMAATQSKAEAAAQYRRLSFDKALRKAFPSFSMSQWQSLQEVEAKLLKKAAPLIEELLISERKLVEQVADEELGVLGLEQVYQLDPAEGATSSDIGENVTEADTSSKSEKHKKKNKPGKQDKFFLERKARTLRDQLEELELSFVKDVIAIAGPANAAAVRAAWVGDVATRGLGGRLLLMGDGVDESRRPLSAILLGSNNHRQDAGVPNRQPVLYVARFPGDPSASQVSTLREIVTAILGQADPESGDEVVVILQTGGGTVTGYGLSAAQLLRIKNANIKLTVAVEQVAASGGYMMCCVADRIVASPFAVLGSIGVISDIPNVYERLKEEGIEFQTVTAGKYKRTLTPTKKVTKQDYEKTKQDIEDIFALFRDFVAKNRPQLDIEKVATGETWFGEDALERNLCDEIKTVDELVIDYVDKGYDVFEVEYKEPSPLGKLISGRRSGTSPQGDEDRGLVGQAVGWLVRTFVAELREELMGTSIAQQTQTPPLQERYMATNDDAKRKRTEA